MYKIYSRIVVIKPKKIYFKKKVYDIVSCDPRFTINKYSVNVRSRRDLTILGADIYNCFHPNATDDSIYTKKHKLKVPDDLKFCLSRDIKGEVYRDRVTEQDIIWNLETWNLDACYYIPHPKLFEASPKWRISEKEYRRMQNSVLSRRNNERLNSQNRR